MRWVRCRSKSNSWMPTARSFRAPERADDCGSWCSAGATTRAETMGWGRCCRPGGARGFAGRHDRRGLSSCRSSTRSISRGRRLALFVDAASDTPAPFGSSRSAAARLEPHDPCARAGSRARRYASSLHPPPPPLSRSRCAGSASNWARAFAEGAERLEAAWAFVQGLLRERSVEEWRRKAGASGA